MVVRVSGRWRPRDEGAIAYPINDLTRSLLVVVVVVVGRWLLSLLLVVISAVGYRCCWL